MCPPGPGAWGGAGVCGGGTAEFCTAAWFNPQVGDPQLAPAGHETGLVTN